MGGAGHNWKAPRWLQNLVPIIALYFTYVIFSKLGYFFVIPPGLVSVMWPVVGIGLGFVYVFGNRVAIGLFLACFTTTISVYDESGNSEFIIAAFLSTATTLHAVVGTALIRRFSEAELYMGNLRDIILFLVLGGPLACTITALIGGLTFYNFTNLPSEQFWGFVETWWIGDVFGFIVFAPLTVMILSYFRRRQTAAASILPTIVFPLVISISIFTFLFHNVKNELLENSFDEFNGDVLKLVNQFTEVLAVDIATLNATSSYFEASEYVTATEFRIFTQVLLKRSSGLYGMSWLPKVRDDERDKFEKNIRNQGYSKFEIKYRNKKGGLETSEKESIYFPIAYTEPYVLNKPAHGLNVFGQDGISGQIRQGILNSARDSGKEKATSRFSIVQKQDEYGFIIFHPVFKQLDRAGLREHIGYINGIFVFPKLTQGLVENASLLNFDFFLNEIAADGGARLLFDSRTDDKKLGPAETYELSEQVHTEHKFDVAGKTWEITFIKNRPLLTGEYFKSLLVLAGGGALFNTLFLIILIMIVSQRNFVQKLVEQRTRDLQSANEELEEFAYRTSHDLRSPIVSSVALLGLADEAISDGNMDMASNSISHAQKSLGKLEILISDILTLTQIGSANEANVFLNISDVIDEAIRKLDHADGFEKLSIERDIRFNGQISTKPSRLKLILENLISNAAKYQDPDEENPTLKISCYRVAKLLYLEFSDNGLGISEEFRGQVFDMFKRFHPKVASGTGLGLYLTKRSARVLDGRISYQHLEKGSLFRLVIPIE